MTKNLAKYSCVETNFILIFEIHQNKISRYTGQKLVL